MWISKKRWIALVKRVADLEVQVQSQADVSTNHKQAIEEIFKATFCTTTLVCPSNISVERINR